MVSIGAAARQALGSHFSVAENEQLLISRLKAGKLVMPPHKTWNLPSSPTWVEDPFNDNNWQFQYHMLRWLDPLRRAGSGGDREAAALWEYWARSWVESNPLGGGRSRWSWIDMSDGIRALELSHGLTVVGDEEWLIVSLWDHVRWLSDSRNLKKGNHGLHQHVGLFVLGVVLEDESVVDLAVGRLSDQVTAAYDKQGSNEEGAISYHLQNYIWWNDALTRLDLEGVPRPQASQRLDRAPELLAHATAPSGNFARIGDTDGSDPRRVDHPLTNYVVSRGQRGNRPASKTAFYDAGYAFMRSGWGETRAFEQETYVTTTWGKQNKIHGHRDGGSVTYAAQGVQWIDDIGKYYYGKHPMRTYVLSREGHNSVCIPSFDYDAAANVELFEKSDNDSYTDLLLSDLGYHGVSIYRRIIYLKASSLLIVLDMIFSEEDVEAQQRWHCGRKVDARQHEFGFSLESGNKSSGVYDLTGNSETMLSRGETDPYAGWAWAGWRRKEPVNMLSFSQTGKEIRFATVVGTADSGTVDYYRSLFVDSRVWLEPITVDANGDISNKSYPR